MLDKATSELVERSTYQAYGGTESDYRPERWKHFREDYRFTARKRTSEGSIPLMDVGVVFRDLGLGNGRGQAFPSYGAARAHMQSYPKGTKFGIVYEPLKNPPGYTHAVAGRNTVVGPIIRDFQATGLPKLWIRADSSFPVILWVF